MGDDGDGCGAVVDHRVGDGSDMGTQARPAAATADDYEIRVGGGLRQQLGGCADGCQLDDCHRRVLSLPRRQRVPEAAGDVRCHVPLGCFERERVVDDRRE